MVHFYCMWVHPYMKLRLKHECVKQHPNNKFFFPVLVTRARSKTESEYEVSDRSSFPRHTVLRARSWLNVCGPIAVSV